jgi:myosin heavy subunit
LIQRVWRGYACRQDFLLDRDSAVSIQRTARGFLARKELKRQQYAALVIQQAWWGLVAHWDMQLAATLIQSRWRGVCAREQFATNILRRDSACAIQRTWRGYYQLIVYAITLESTISIQKVARGFLARKKLPVLQCQVDVTTIQSVWRAFLVQVQYELDLLDIISIQNLARQKIVMREHLWCLPLCRCSACPWVKV